MWNEADSFQSAMMGEFTLWKLASSTHHGASSLAFTSAPRGPVWFLSQRSSRGAGSGSPGNDVCILVPWLVVVDVWEVGLVGRLLEGGEVGRDFLKLKSEFLMPFIHSTNFLFIPPKSLGIRDARIKACLPGVLGWGGTTATLAL